jgi:hypothetical protein
MCTRIRINYNRNKFKPRSNHTQKIIDQQDMNQLYLTGFGAVSKPILTFDNTYGRTSGYKPWHQHSCIQELCIEMLYVVSQIVAGMAFQATSGS